MTKLGDINLQIRLMLDDSAAVRFSDNLLRIALSQALEEINQRIPRILTTEHAVTLTGRDQSLLTVTRCRYLISVMVPTEDGSSRELQPETCFTYTLNGATPTLHFLGSSIPSVGDRLLVRYCAGYAIEGFNSDTSTTLPVELENALVEGSAARACILRAGSLVESYGLRNDETNRLMEIGRNWEKDFYRLLNGLKTMQEFGFPPGFPLDKWDGAHR